MAKAKTIKKTAATGEETVIRKVKGAADEPKEYSADAVFSKGDIVYHKIWDDTGEVIEVGSTDDGLNKIKVAFTKVGLKNLRMG